MSRGKVDAMGEGWRDGGGVWSRGRVEGERFGVGEGWRG